MGLRLLEAAKRSGVRGGVRDEMEDVLATYHFADQNSISASLVCGLFKDSQLKLTNFESQKGKLTL